MSLKWCRCLHGLLLLVLLAAHAGESAAEIVTSDAGYTITIPEDWEIKQGPGAAGQDDEPIDLIAHVTEAPGKRWASVLVIPFPLLGEFELEYESDEQLLEMVKFFLVKSTVHPDGTVEEHTPEIRLEPVGDRRLVVFDESIIEDGTVFYERGYVMIGGRSIFMLEFRTLDRDKQDKIPVFDKIAESFAFTGDTGSSGPGLTAIKDNNTLIIILAVAGGLILIVGGAVVFAVMNAKKKARKKAERRARLDRARGG